MNNLLRNRSAHVVHPVTSIYRWKGTVEYGVARSPR